MNAGPQQMLFVNTGCDPMLFR